MKKIFIPIVLILVGLVVLLPFASSSPDGLETVTGKLGVEEQTPAWQGAMPDYTVDAIENSYASTALAGIIGTIMVLLAAFIVGVALAKSNQRQTQA